MDGKTRQKQHNNDNIVGYCYKSIGIIALGKHLVVSSVLSIMIIYKFMLY